MRAVPEGYVDLAYQPNGFPVLERAKRTWDPEDVAERAVRIVRERRLDEARVRSFADGRIYSGRQARVLKMVDELGGLEDAIEAAGKLAGIAGKPRVIYPRRRFSLRDLLSSQLGLGAATGLLPALPSLKTPLYLMP